jgi:hypothetical protein
MKATLQLGLTGPDLHQLFTSVAESQLAGSGRPERLTVDTKPQKISDDWATTHLAKARRTLMAEWDNGAGMLALQAGRIVKLTRQDHDVDPERLLSQLAELPFEVASTESLYPAWTDGTLGTRYDAPNFAELHLGHGWACVFRGPGHQRLVSRRWLEFGPWKVHRGAKDTTLVQFHQIGVDAAAALAQARIGHERMGISDTGGFIQARYVYAADLRGLYDKTKRELHVAVHGREVSQREMLDACAARLYQPLGPDKPFDNVVYVFMEKEPAIAHLHELFLRELGCHAIVEGTEVDLAADYKPQPIPIEWTRRA